MRNRMCDSRALPLCSCRYNCFHPATSPCRLIRAPTPSPSRMATQRRNKAKGAQSAALDSQASVVHHDDSPTFDQEHADDEPLVTPAVSAWEDFACQSEPIAAPASQLVDDSFSGDDSDDDAAPAPAPFDPSVQTNGSRLNLPPSLRAMFERRRDELLRTHPDLLTRDLSGDSGHHAAGDDSCWPRADYIILALLFLLLCFVLHAEYDIDLLAIIAQKIKDTLDPGPIQRAMPRETGDDFAAVREALASGRK